MIHYALPSFNSTPLQSGLIENHSKWQTHLEHHLILQTTGIDARSTVTWKEGAMSKLCMVFPHTQYSVMTDGHISTDRCSDSPAVMRGDAKHFSLLFLRVFMPRGDSWHLGILMSTAQIYFPALLHKTYGNQNAPVTSCQAIWSLQENTTSGNIQMILI